jgi:hypothetical protein
LRVKKLGFTNALKMEYQLCLGTLEDLRRGKGTANEEMPRVITAIAGNLAIRERKTRQILVDKFRSILRHSDSNYCDIPIPENEPHSMTLIRGAELVIRGNPIGELLIQKLPWSSYSVGLVEERVELTGTKLVVAAAWYRKTTGTLPNSWSDLVPKYLPEVPIDPYNGLPFHYLRDQKIIYSVGRDLQDDNGSSRFNKRFKRDRLFSVD